MKAIYAVLAVLGFILPIYLLVPFVNGFNLDAFLRACFADLAISSIVFWAFLFTQRVRHAWIYVLLNLLVGLSFALPLFLFVHERSQHGTAGA